MFFVLIINWIRCKVKMSRETEEEHIDFRATELYTLIRNWDKPYTKRFFQDTFHFHEDLRCKPKSYKNKYLLFVQPS